MRTSAVQPDQRPARPVARLAIAVLKIAVSLAIIGYLVVRAVRHDSFRDLVAQPKHWLLLAAALACWSLAVVLSHVRWYGLVRALGLPIRCRQAVRIGLLGYLFNLAPLGIVGGDVLKVWLLIRQVGGHHGKATASVVVDRVIGIYTLLVMACAAIGLSGFWRQGRSLYDVSVATLLTTAAATAALAGLFVLGLLGRPLWGRLQHVPRIGRPLVRLVLALQIYQRKWTALLVATLLTIGFQSLYVLAIYLLGAGLYDQMPSLALDFVAMPLASLTGVLPVSLGPFEGALELLYTGLNVAAGRGLIVALAARIASVLVASLGAGYYLATKGGAKSDVGNR